MSRKLICLLALVLVGSAFAPALVAQETLGYLFFDSNAPGSEFDIQNATGADDFLSPDTNPVTTTVTFSSLQLVVSFETGPNQIFTESYFTASPFDTTSLSGAEESAFTSLTDPAVSAVLTGALSTTSLSLSGVGSPVTVLSTFSTTITDPTGLEPDVDYAIITAKNASTGPSGPPGVTPEPESLVMVATGLVAGLAGFRRRIPAFLNRKTLGSVAMLAIAGLALIAPVKAHAAIGTTPITLSATALNPTPLVGGTTSLTGAVSIASVVPPVGSVNVNFATTCGGTPVASNNPSSITKAAVVDHIGVNVPTTLTSGTYYISLTGALTSTPPNCSAIQVTVTTTTLAACVPTSSLAVTVGANVNAYVPFAYWDNPSNPGIEEVPLEGTGTAQNFTTPSGVNSCAANSTTGEVVCTENNANVDVITGSTLTTLTSGSNTYAGFSGGDCENCGVGINPSSNTAVIGMGLAGSPSYSGVQVLNLSNNTFNTAFPLNNEVSEDISIDSGRNLILSPNEDGNYDLLKIGSGNTLTEYSNYTGSATLDSAAEDCTTGIALASDEFTDEIYITDLTQAVFSTSTWSAPGQYINLNDGGYSAGTCGISTAPGTGHLAVVTGEFGGSAYSALLLPSTSGSGTPTLADYAYVSGMPATPDGNYFSAGYDPHTVTAYTSPNNSKSYAVFADYYYGYPNWLGVVDLACVLAQPRTAGTHNVVGSASTCTRYVAVP
jgi:hypothetical protein